MYRVRLKSSHYTGGIDSLDGNRHLLIQSHTTQTGAVVAASASDSLNNLTFKFALNGVNSVR